MPENRSVTLTIALKPSERDAINAAADGADERVTVWARDLLVRAARPDLSPRPADALLSAMRDAADDGADSQNPHSEPE